MTATCDIGEILALGADCVLYMPAACDLDQVCAILAAGTNIVTTRGEFHHPGSMRAGRPGTGRAGVRRGRRLHSQHRLEPRVHQRGDPAGPDVDPAPP